MTALRVLGDDDVSMTPNIHPWLGRRVTTLQTGQAGEIVDVTNRGRVKVAVEGPGKRAIFIESKGASFEALFTAEPEAEMVPELPDPPQAAVADPQATPEDPQASEVESPDVSKDAHLVADSDAESVPPAQGSDEDDEPIVAAPKRRGRDGKRPAKAAAVKRPAASVSSAPKRRRQSRSLGNVD